MKDIPFEFKIAGFQLLDIPWEHRWLNDGKITSLTQGKLMDDEGVGMSRINGQLHTHPVSLSAFLMTRMDQYYYLHDPLYLDLCIRQAERLMERSIESRGAAYIPYQFQWNLHFHVAEPTEVPWFSGMAQGYALMAFCRMYELTGAERYLDFAHKVFQSFLNIQLEGVPWFVQILDSNLLWFEEYARDNGPSDGAFNGHLYAVLGLHEYWLTTRDERAVKLADGGMTALLSLMDLWRFPGGQSFYCFNHRSRVASYHHWHCKQLGYAFNITGDPIWIRLQDLFMDDYPMQIWPEPPTRSKLIVEPGTYQVSAPGDLTVTTHETVEFKERAEFDFNVRGQRYGERGPSTRISDPAYKNMWMKEEPGNIYVSGITEHVGWAHSISITVQTGAPNVVDFDESGQEVDRITTSFQQGDTVNANERARIRGEGWLKISGGRYGGHWIATRDVEGLS